MLGYVTHLIADSITTSGIPLFYPKHKRIGLRLFDTGSVGEAIIKYGCFAVIGMKIISFFQ
jgi:inner membrane protein